jgi:hypothetical protein
MKEVEVIDWNNQSVVLNKSKYIKKFTEKMDFLDILVNYDASSSEERDGASYYIESPSEDQFSQVMCMVSDMASNEFERLYVQQMKVV